MKQYRQILEEIKKNRESIEAKTAEIMSLDFMDERQEAAGNHNFEAVKAYREKAKANNEKIIALSEEVARLEILNQVLQENAKHARTAEALPIIFEVYKKYDGKKAGEKTREKIREELNKAGYSAYIDNGHNVNFEELDENGFTHCNRLTIYGAYNNPIITDENKINVLGFTSVKNPFNYCENPAEAVEEIIKKGEDVKKAYEEANRIAAEYNEMIPRTMRKAETANNYFVIK